MWWVVDRIEGAIAVMIRDDGVSINVRSAGLREGQVFRLRGRTLVRDKREEDRRARAARRQLELLKRTDPGGNIQL